MIIDAKDMILGRLATKVAKLALLGEKVDLVNCEKAVITGSKEVVLEKYKKRYLMGTPRYGPFLPRRPDFFVRRIIRGMLPWKKKRGKEAFKRIRCYIGVPDAFKNEKIVQFKEFSVENSNAQDYITVEELTKLLGGIKNE